METHNSFDGAMGTLQSTGAVRMPGRKAAWSRATRWLLLVLICFVCLLPVVLVVVLVATWGQFQIGVGTIMGFLGFLVMLAGALTLVVWGYRRHTTSSAQELQDVTLDASGLTLRGIGPIPWQDFGPADYRMVRSEHGSAFTRRAVMPLTPSGLVMVNERTPLALRSRISPATGAFWKARHLNIYVPGVEGMTEGEVMQLINTAHWMFVGQSASGGVA
ncbi:hypothetical protein [Arthrobacter sp.]|uniref:hypothetical protein n=1 Tax=Arthrobacter sp. TaxID=1667 RepID=UPI003A9022A3